MVLFIILGVVVVIALVVLAVLFFMLGKEGKKEERKNYCKEKKTFSGNKFFGERVSKKFLVFGFAFGVLI